MANFHPVGLVGADHLLVHDIHFHVAFLAVLVGGVIGGAPADDGVKNVGDVGALDGAHAEPGEGAVSQGR
jgi:hypothetical protein